MEEIFDERLELVRERLDEMQAELSEGGEGVHGASRLFFAFGASELCKQIAAYDLRKKRPEMSLEELQRENSALYESRMPESYVNSFLNPAHASSLFGSEIGPILSAIINEVTCAITAAFFGDGEELVIRAELFLELHTACMDSLEELGRMPDSHTLREILYYYAFDYSDMIQEKRVRAQVDPEAPEDQHFYQIVMNSDLSDLRYLYQYGMYISENELEMARHLNSLSEETIALMADTYSEGYRIGFELGNKSLEKNHKKTVDVRYPIGFERMIRRAITNFEKMNLAPTMYRCYESSLWKYSTYTIGCFSSPLNKQLDYDHREDEALILDGNYKTRRVETRKEAFELVKDLARGHAGPAVIETFGERPFSPKANEHAPKYCAEQRQLRTAMVGQVTAMNNTYIPGEERSFTVIAFPIPEIGERFQEIFDEIVRINTLDYETYSRVQTTMIDALNLCEYVLVKGNEKVGNRTDIRVELCKLTDANSQAIFENCVADVNIPVGEVFTSPVLKGTNGTLHVGQVYLEGLCYKDLCIEIVDGMTGRISCGGFDTAKEGEDYVRENVLFHHDSLPVGEFAIGTNTTAYVAAEKYKIADLLPILIAEKTGPHFALGDTCYSHSEDVRVFNADGKEIVAKDNEVSILRKSKPQEAYYDCHTDITIPYRELDYIRGYHPDGSYVSIIEGGRFVLKGCEELNTPLDNIP